MKISLLAGGGEQHYQLGLVSGLFAQGIEVDVIGNDVMQDADVLKKEKINFYNLRGDQNPNTPIKEKIFRIVKYYCKLVKYATESDSKLLHIQWLNKFIYFDMTFLNIYYKVLGKKLVFTAHNINAGERDGNDSMINRLCLRFMYKIVDHIIVHTNKMKLQLIEDFNIRENKVSVIPHGINTIVPRTELTKTQARKKLHLKCNEKIMLFFGRITSYKGLEHLLLSLVNLKEKYDDLRLVIAGNIERGCQEYWENINGIIKKHDLSDYVIEKIEFVPDEDIEVYCKSSDVLILPYKNIFQTGVLFLAYNFGLPVIATDVGSISEEILEGKTGFICQPEDPKDLAEKVELYFQSDLYKNLETSRVKIINYAKERYSWEIIGEKTCAVYRNLL